MGFTRRLHRSDDGAGVALALMMGAILVGFATVVATSGASQSRAVDFDEDWERALQAAEAGAELGLRNVDADAGYGTGQPEGTLLTTAAVIAAADAVPADEVHLIPGAEFVVLRAGGDETVFGVGFAPSRDAISRRVRVVAVDYVPGTVYFSLPGEAAIIANGGTVVLSGGSITASVPASSHAAGIIANASVVLSGSDSFVDGNVITTGTVNAPSQVYGVVQEGAAAFVFPSDAEIEAWRADLIASARSEARLRTGDIVYHNDTITAPMYVTGDLTLKGDITILGSGVIYVTGTIQLDGNALVQLSSVILASGEGTVFTGSSEYRLTDPSAGGGLVSFGVDSKALRLTGGSEGTVQGIAFAPFGGIEVSGSSVYHGALVSRGSGVLGGVSLTGGADVIYPVALANSGFFVGLAPAPTASVGFRSER